MTALRPMPLHSPHSIGRAFDSALPGYSSDTDDMKTLTVGDAERRPGSGVGRQPALRREHRIVAGPAHQVMELPPADTAIAPVIERKHHRLAH